MTKSKTTTYQNEAGRKLNFFQIAKLGVVEGAEVQQTGEGFFLDGELFTPIENEADDEEH